MTSVVKLLLCKNKDHVITIWFNYFSSLHWCVLLWTNLIMPLQVSKQRVVTSVIELLTFDSISIRNWTRTKSISWYLGDPVRRNQFQLIGRVRVQFLINRIFDLVIGSTIWSNLISISNYLAKSDFGLQNTRPKYSFLFSKCILSNYWDEKKSKLFLEFLTVEKLTKYIPKMYEELDAQQFAKTVKSSELNDDLNIVVYYHVHYLFFVNFQRWGSIKNAQTWNRIFIIISADKIWTNFDQKQILKL